MADLFDYRDKYPNAPGYKKRPTAKKAAEDVVSKAKSLRVKCLKILKEVYPAGRTPHQLAAELGEDINNIRPRCTELFEQGKIFDTGTKGETPSGKKCIIWAAVREKAHGPN